MIKSVNIQKKYQFKKLINFSNKNCKNNEIKKKL